MPNFMPERDEFDYAAYELQTKFSAKIRPASDFAKEVHDIFFPPEGKPKDPHMFSTKLRDKLRFRPGEVTVYGGYNKHRKSMFTGQIALDLCIQREKTLVVSLEMLPEQTIGRMAKQASAGKATNEFLHRFNTWTDDRLWLFDHVGRITPTECRGLARYFATECGGKHVFIDSLMMICASETQLDEQKEFGTNLVRLAQETGLHIHLIMHCRKPEHGDESRYPCKYDLRGSASIPDQVHNIVMVWANLAKARDPNNEEMLVKPDALVLVEGQRNGAFSGKLQLWFDEPSFRFCDDRLSRVEPYLLSSIKPGESLQ